MSEVLVIRLGSHFEDNIPWMIWSQVEQEIIASGDIDGVRSLVELSEKAQSRQVKVLVPASDITFKKVPLPGKFNRQVLAALPYMLEDDLAQDVEDLFFAHGKKTQIDGAPAIEVAVVSRQVMSDWLSWLKSADIYSQTIVPDALCLPSYDSGVAAIELSGQWLLRNSDWSADAIDASWFGDYINICAAQHLASQQQDEGDNATELERLNLICFSPCDIQSDDVVVTDEDRQLPLQLLASHIDGVGFNLLQGEFVPKKESSQAWRTWRVAAVVAFVAILLQMGYRGSTIWQLEQQIDEQKAQFVQQYKQAFPGDRTRTNLMERQLKKRLKEVTGGGGAGGESFLAMLERVAPIFSQSGGFQPEIIKFDNKRKELRLNAIADGYQSFEKFKTAVEALGYQVQQGSLSNNDDKVAGVITIKGA